MVCNKGDKPIITYNFAGGINKKYQSALSPIDITTKISPVESTENYDDQGYQITFRNTRCGGATCVFIVRDYNTLLVNGVLSLIYIPCGQTTFAKNSDGSLDSYAFNFGGITTVTVNKSVTCGGSSTGRCSIIISHNGQQIFQDQGNCPVNYTVQCGKCPEGTCECPSPIYPGYCCLDCASTANSIRSITNDLRAKNG